MRFLPVFFLCMLAALPAWASKEYPLSFLEEFCNQKVEGKPRPVPPAPGIQFDAKAADSKVMGLIEGTYANAQGAVILLTEKGRFYLYPPKGSYKIEGTSGDDFIGAGVLGGCSREQLSEALKVNGFDAATFSLKVPDQSQGKSP